MNQEIRNLKPRALWNFFADLNAVPRASKKEEKIRRFMVDFGKSLNLETLEDEIGNVIIKKPASKGMENRKTVILQSHLDMVHQKNDDTDFDFDTQGIEMEVDGDWVMAKGTTLGADNGLGVASIMAILASQDIEHPPIEALFTIDEETGMTGAQQLDGSLLNGKILLNLDTEDDDEIGIGCAGGVDVTAHRTYDLENIDDDDFYGMKISVKGLKGGHSGMEIHKGLGNSNKILARLLTSVESKFRIAEFEGGGLRNAIPREAWAKIVVKNEDVAEIERAIEAKAWDIKKEFNEVDPKLQILIDAKVTAPDKSLSEKDTEDFLSLIKNLHNGVYKMSENMPGLVEASNNVAKIELKEGKAEIENLTRSSIESTKDEVSQLLEEAFSKAGFTTELSGSYPGWQPNPNSEILKLLENLYLEMFSHKPNVVACHAGLECGILGERIPGLDMISFGPTILGAHSPDEKVSISSTQKFWKYLLNILEKIPNK
ncbi:Cytosol non-specific dipeptidase [Candidatus Ornithobacterium hominis]|uniref:Cytosol non-specific dipeptidase n=1 Tax=Candidatus Ornithobacterium hominis TaxID=2497989 RepID=A0A383TVS6_9FLAO|nr:aminoacyl-histidine dipeptidase [Candidatus Ornithobacterium hominis]MCT7903683.1 aminoacyl-histidine dipeptidase [Candidatus Ornithobacterium hominis]SZD71021.1 Cytosol non-specific dipeptidase [Candidatus Ornithobacterium hominis]SZD71697.1 Cytosol non-specific dipeptidase [Candidatus Ornithobacterium hominis]